MIFPANLRVVAGFHQMLPNILCQQIFHNYLIVFTHGSLLRGYLHTPDDMVKNCHILLYPEKAFQTLRLERAACLLSWPQEGTFLLLEVPAMH